MVSRIEQVLRSGREQVHRAGEVLGVSVLDFWRWSSSDLLSNATRGIFAEFVVAHALCGSVEGVRTEWDAFDVKTPEGIKVEVKSAAYIQSWEQKRHSAIIFGIQPTRAWNEAEGIFETDRRRQADVYVFALLANKDQATLDPLDVGQWEFYAVPTEVLNEKCPRQKKISLGALKRISGEPVGYEELRDAVLKAAEPRSVLRTRR